MNIDSFINDLFNSNATSNAAQVNDSERDGNTDDLLFRFEQAGLNIQGGTTNTSIAPYTAVQDLLNGKMSLGAWIALGVFAALGFWLLKK